MLLLVQMLVNDPAMQHLQLLGHLKFGQWCYLSVHGFVMPQGQKTGIQMCCEGARIRIRNSLFNPLATSINTYTTEHVAIVRRSAFVYLEMKRT